LERPEPSSDRQAPFADEIQMGDRRMIGPKHEKPFPEVRPLEPPPPSVEGEDGYGEWLIEGEHERRRKGES
jgi:hypothetical protein